MLGNIIEHLQEIGGNIIKEERGGVAPLRGDIIEEGVAYSRMGGIVEGGGGGDVVEGVNDVVGGGR